jgi:hypothetical protein
MPEDTASTCVEHAQEGDGIGAGNGAETETEGGAKENVLADSTEEEPERVASRIVDGGEEEWEEI